MEINQTWELVQLQKSKEDSSDIHYKIRLVAKGYVQKEEINYYEIFSGKTSIQILLALIAQCNLELAHLDIKIVFFCFFFCRMI